MCSPLAFVVTSVTDRDNHLVAQADSSLSNRRAPLNRSLATDVSVGSPMGGQEVFHWVSVIGKYQLQYPSIVCMNTQEFFAGICVIICINMLKSFCWIMVQKYLPVSHACGNLMNLCAIEWFYAFSGPLYGNPPQLERSLALSLLNVFKVLHFSLMFIE